MSSQVLVTVVIPNYNHASYLKQRIDSVLQQTFQDFELLILDDYSTDNSLEIIHSYQSHPKVKRIIQNKTNAGSLFIQWKKAIELAQGKYLWIAESDDFASPEFLEKTAQIAEEHENTGLVFTDSIIVDQEGEALYQASNTNKVLSKFKDLEYYRTSDKNNVLPYFVSDLIIWNASSVLFKTEIIKKIDLKVLQRLKNAGDLFTYISIALRNDVIYLNQPLNNFRKHDHNTTTKNVVSGALFLDRMIIVKYYFKELLSLSEEKKHLKLFLRRNFITAVDFKLYNAVSSLLKEYHNNKVISFSTYMKLSLYVWYCKAFGTTPHAYRVFIKRVLVNK